MSTGHMTNWRIIFVYKKHGRIKQKPDGPETAQVAFFVDRFSLEKQSEIIVLRFEAITFSTN